MDKRQNNTNRNANNGYQTQNNSTTKRLFQKRNYNTRPNRRYVPTRRNRLQRVQNALNMNRSYQQPNPKRVYNKFSMNTNLIPYYYNSTNPIRYTKREIFIKGLPRYIDNRGLFNLFKKEGRIINCNVLYDNVGFSRGIGKIEFLNYRDAWKVINKWNNITYKGFTLKVEYKKTKNQTASTNNRNYVQFHNYQQNNNYSRKFNGNKFNYNNYRYTWNNY